MRAEQIRRRSGVVEFESLESRNAPAIITLVQPPPGVAPANVNMATRAGLVDLTGPGLQNNGQFIRINYEIGQNKPLNNDDTPDKEHVYSEDVIFGRTGYIDAVYQATNSPLNQP